MAKKIILKVCRSCISQNPQTDKIFGDEARLRETYAQKNRKGFWGTHAELQIVDCLTNCENPNAVQIERKDGEILLGHLTTETLVDEVFQLVQNLKNTNIPLATSEKLRPYTVFIRGPQTWKPGTNAEHADRIKL